MARPTSIGWSVDRDGRGYTIRTYNADGSCDVYQAGNHPRVSDAYVPASHHDAVPPDRLAEHARLTAVQHAREMGLDESAVYHDPDGQSD